MIYTLKIVVLVFVILFEIIFVYVIRKDKGLDKSSRLALLLTGLLIGAEAVLMFA